MLPTLGSSTLLDRMAHVRRDREVLAALAAADAARFLVLIDGKPVIGSTPARDAAWTRWLTRDELAACGVHGTVLNDAIFLGVEPTGGAPRFALAIRCYEIAPFASAAGPLAPAVDLRTLASQGSMAPGEVSLLAQAKALSEWHAGARCCGRCGAETAARDGGWKRVCTACGNDLFPRLDPVVIMLVTDGARCLLGRERRFPERMFSALAGFVEPGEDVEHAVRRETWEEVGLEIGEVQYIASQPWPFPHALMIGCVAWATTAVLTIDPSEILEARWFDRAEAALLLSGTHPEGLWVPGKQAIAHTLISAFAHEQPAF